MGEAGYTDYVGLGLAGLKSFHGCWNIGTVPSYLEPAPGVIRAEEQEPGA